MEQEIHFTNKDFDFSKLSLSQPMAVQGGAYFTKLKFNSEPFYIQTPKCITKQGINETSKKAYIDLMFSSEDEEVIEWFEALESTLITLIFQKKHLWFQDDIEYSDIENFFNPITRAYKGGKYHLVRTTIGKNKTSNQYSCGVYDENENVLPITDIKETNIIIPILEVIGIKFSARNFQLELVGKQIMVLNNKPSFNSCLIKRTNNSTNINKENSLVVSEPILEKKEENNLQKKDTIKNNNIIEELLNDDDNENENENDNENDNDNEYLEETLTQKDNKHNNLEEVKEDNLEIKNSNDLEDISDNITTNLKKEIKLKNPNEVYMEIYKIAKQKAKQHKKAAISAYLEAKKIKNTYLLEDLDNSDDSSEEEMDSDAESIKKEIDEIIEELN